MKQKPGELAERFTRYPHLEVEDGWYSCPMAPGYFGPEENKGCTCGAERVRKLARAYLRLLEANLRVALVPERDCGIAWRIHVKPLLEETDA